MPDTNRILRSKQTHWGSMAPIIRWTRPLRRRVSTPMSSCRAIRMFRIWKWVRKRWAKAEMLRSPRDRDIILSRQSKRWALMNKGMNSRKWRKLWISQNQHRMLNFSSKERLLIFMNLTKFASQAGSLWIQMLYQGWTLKALIKIKEMNIQIRDKWGRGPDREAF